MSVAHAMRLLTVIGARPQFIKAAAVSRAIREHNAAAGSEPIHEVLVHAGQLGSYQLSVVSG